MLSRPLDATLFAEASMVIKLSRALPRFLGMTHEVLGLLLLPNLLRLHYLL